MQLVRHNLRHLSPCGRNAAKGLDSENVPKHGITGLGSTWAYLTAAAEIRKPAGAPVLERVMDRRASGIRDALLDLSLILGTRMVYLMNRTRSQDRLDCLQR